MSEEYKKVLRVGTSGMASMLVDVLVLILLVELFVVQVALAALLASAVGAIVSFVLNKFWAFRDFSPLRATQVLSFVGVALGSALGVAACVQILSVQLGMPYLGSKAIAATFVFAFWSYPVQSRLVFVRRVAV